MIISYSCNHSYLPWFSSSFHLFHSNIYCFQQLIKFSDYCIYLSMKSLISTFILTFVLATVSFAQTRFITKRIVYSINSKKEQALYSVQVYRDMKHVGQTNNLGEIELKDIGKGETITFHHRDFKTYIYVAAEKNPVAVQEIIMEDFDFTQDAVPPPMPPPPSKENPNEIDNILEEPAEYPGGRAALMKFLQNNLTYPQTAIESGLQGKCYLRFVVAKDGAISNVTVVKKVPDCPECDEEAIRVVKMMPKWIPGKAKGKAVNSYFNLPINFKLADENIGNHDPVPPPPPPNPPAAFEKDVYEYLDEPAQFPGGLTAMNTYITKNLKYPQAVIDKPIQGKCYVKFVVDTEGSISDVKITRGIKDCPECDQEAIRLVKAMPKWIPGKNNGKVVKSYFNLPIEFKLSEAYNPSGTNADPMPVALPEIPKDEPVADNTDEPAQFKGGPQAIYAFIAKNLRYPQSAVANRIEGKCFLKFIIEKDGSIGDVIIVKGVDNCPQCDQEAVRVLKMMPKWTPGKKGGKVVRSYYALPVNFQLS